MIINDIDLIVNSDNLVDTIINIDNFHNQTIDYISNIYYSIFI